MKRANLFFTASLVPLDFITLLSAAAFAYHLRFSPLVTAARPVVFSLKFEEFFNAAAAAAVLFLIIFALSGLYSIKPRKIATEIIRIILASSAGIATVLAIAFFSRELFESRFILLAAWLFSIIFIIGERVLIHFLQKTLYKFGIGQTKTAIIGKTKIGQNLKKYFQNNPGKGYKTVAHFAVFNNTTQKELLHLKKKGQIDAIILADPEMDKKQILKAKTFSDIEQIDFFYSAELFPSTATHPIVHMMAGQPVIEVPKTPLDGWGAIYKRIFDIIVAVILIILSMPIQILAALAIFVESPGNVFFLHERVGKGGKIYKHLKFRTMIKNAHKYRFDPEFLEKYGNERDGSPLFKLKNDPRILKTGKFIRKFSIDEIPEFYMVLIGKMSLVGPRPHLPKEVENYKPYQKQVLTIKPGITGLAQVSGRADLDFDEEVALDMHYIQNWNPWLDFIILAKTPIAVLFKKGAY
ncbi:sugar transferase [Candidatus Parcubacteria bacterium]|nr:MAG: sugar transferase [Candidatus Parcubacteria bacterium]